MKAKNWELQGFAAPSPTPKGKEETKKDSGQSLQPPALEIL